MSWTSLLPIALCLQWETLSRMNCRDSYLFLLAATNHVDRIDPAIQSRFRERIVIPLPGRDTRVRLLSIMLKDKKLGFPVGDGALLLSNLFEGRNWSGRDLDTRVAAAEQKALLRAVRSGGPDHYEIQIEDFELVVR
jgi:AAA+ superfamily predicted ATPase